MRSGGRDRALVGCEDADESPRRSAATNQFVPPEAQLAATPAPAQQPPAQAAPGLTAAPADPQPVAPGNVERQVAEAGVGKKGQGYGGGIITEPIHQYFIIQDRIIFEVQIPQAMNTFHAEKNRYPKDMAEFESAILKPGSIVLPDLRAGDRYIYDAKEHQLMVERRAP